MVLNVRGWREVCRGVVRRGMEVCCSIVCGKMEGSQLWCCTWRGEGGLLWHCVWRGREVCSGVVHGEMEGGLLWYCVWRGREVCSGVVPGEMEGGLLWYCVWRDGGRFVELLNVGDGGRSVVVLYVEREGEGRGEEVCCGIVFGEMEGGLLWC